MEERKIPENVRYILARLKSAGFEAYVAGGAVRDSLSGKTPDDWDVCDVCASPGSGGAVFRGSCHSHRYKTRNGDGGDGTAGKRKNRERKRDREKTERKRITKRKLRKKVRWK